MSNNDDQHRRTQLLKASAEAQLTGDKATEKLPPAPATDELLQELLVHRIELEMQNEELRRAHLALEASHEHYRELYDLAPVGYLTLTAEGVIAEINLTGAKLLGMARKQLMNRRFAKVVDDEYKDLWYRHFMHAKQSVEKHSCELPFRTEHGITLYYHLDCQYVAKDDASPLLRVVLTDVTERKQIEDELRIAAAAFESQEGIIVADANKIILRVNRAFTRITGYSAKEAIGKPPAILRSDRHSEDFYQQLWASVVSDRYWQGEIWNKRKDGEIYPVWQTVTAVTDTDKVITHYIGAFTDITQRKQAEKVLLDARQRLENQVATTQDELANVKEETAEVNAALNILLRYRDADKSDAQLALSQEVESTVLPFLKKLKKTCVGRTHSTHLVDVLEANILDLVQSYGRPASLAAIYQQLTPVEAQVASMIRQGLPTKVIAMALNSSPGTISIHRKHIRKKLGLDGKTNNLSSHLQSLSE